jgi:hypothetical protein
LARVFVSVACRTSQVHALCKSAPRCKRVILVQGIFHAAAEDQVPAALCRCRSAGGTRPRTLRACGPVSSGRQSNPSVLVDCDHNAADRAAETDRHRVQCSTLNVKRVEDRASLQVSRIVRFYRLCIGVAERISRTDRRICSAKTHSNDNRIAGGRRYTQAGRKRSVRRARHVAVGALLDMRYLSSSCLGKKGNESE